MSSDLDGTDDGLASREEDDGAEQRRLHEIAVRLADKVTSLPADLSKRAEESLAEAFARVGTFDGPESDVASQSKELYGQILEGKYRQGKL